MLLKLPSLLRLGVLFVAGVCLCEGREYRFEKIIARSATGNLFGVAVAGIDNRGRVILNSNLGSFSYSNGALTPIADPAGQQTLTPLGLNERNEMLVAAQRGNGPLQLAVFGSSGSITPIYNITGNFSRASDLHEAVFTDSGKVAIQGDFLNGSKGVLTLDGGNPVTISSSAEPTNIYAGLSMNTAGTVVFGRFSVLASTPAVLLAGSGGALTTIASDTDPLSLTLFNTFPSINDAGDIAFLATDDATRRRNVYLHRAGQNRMLVDGAAYSSMTGLILNNAGEVVFQAYDRNDSDIRGIFTGPNLTGDRVIRSGDPLFGSTVLVVGLGSGGQVANQLYFNDRGQVVFEYSLANGEYGLALATPVQASGPPPTLTSGAVLNGASFVREGQPGHAVAPGSIISVFGANFAPALDVAPGAPLPNSLSGVSVTVNGSPAPLFFVSPNQINALMPVELTAASVRVAVTTPNGASAALDVPLASHSPAIYTLDQSGGGQGIVTFVNSANLAAPDGRTPGSRPARAGDILTIYANGLGPVTPAITSGNNSCNPVSVCAPDFSNLVLRNALTRPQIEIGGVLVPDANISFAGLAPQFVGLFQINFTVPSGLPSGAAIPIVLRQGAARSRPDVTLALQ